jgi:DNA modification methylase
MDVISTHGGGDKYQSLKEGITPPIGEYREHIGRFPANLIHDGSEEVEAEFAKYGERKSGWTDLDLGMDKNPTSFSIKKVPGNGLHYSDKGSASRFFYSAKASAKDRQGSKHPTVKPISLMRYLCKLVTPPGGTILDPFAGSGTTGQAAVEQDFQVILIEKEAEYVADIKKRMEAIPLTFWQMDKLQELEVAAE